MTAFIPELILGGIFTVLLTICAFLWQRWSKDWETRLIARDARLSDHAKKLEEHDDRHGKHDVKLAVLTTELKSMNNTLYETSVDVKELLQRTASDGRRSTN